MKFYYDGVLICGAKTQKYKYAIVYPSSQERWVMHTSWAGIGRSIVPGRSLNCTRRRRSSGGQGTNARVDGLDWVPEGNASGTFSLRRLFSTGKNFPHTALHSLDG